MVSWENLSLSLLSQVAHTSGITVLSFSSRPAYSLVSEYLCRTDPALLVPLKIHLILGYLYQEWPGSIPPWWSRCSHTARLPCHIWGTRTLLSGSFLVLSLF